METPFEYDHESAVALCKEYSGDPELLETVIKKLKIEVGTLTVINSPFRDDLKALHMKVVVNGYAFDYHASHHDAMVRTKLASGDWKERAKLKKEWERFRNGLLYSILSCIKTDILCSWDDPEDMGLNPDSIKDMAKWNELKEHAKKLSRALQLTREELFSLPS